MSEEQIKKFKEEILLNREYSGESNYIFVDDEEILQLINLIEKQDKMINEILASWKQDDIRSIEELKEYFRKKVEDEN